MATPSDKRSASRFLPVFELRVCDKGSGQNLGFLVDASPSGIRIACPVPLKVGTRLNLTIEAGAEGNSSTVSCSATVRWCKSSDIHPSINIAGLELAAFENTQSENELLRMLLSECIQAA